VKVGFCQDMTVAQTGRATWCFAVAPECFELSSLLAMFVARFEVLTVVRMPMMMISVLTPYVLVGGYGRFGDADSIFSETCESSRRQNLEQLLCDGSCSLTPLHSICVRSKILYNFLSFPCFLHAAFLYPHSFDHSNGLLKRTSS
jgi:hypothetical protein